MSGRPAHLGIVGVGAIAEAIVTGLCEGRDAAPAVHLSPRSAARAGRLAARLTSVRVAESNQAVVDEADVVLVCVRPPDAAAVLSDLTFRAEQAVISVVAGVAIDALRPLAAPADELVRAIPLPAVATRGGLTAIHPPHEVARAIFDPLGGVIAVEPIDFTALAGEYATAGGLNEQFLAALRGAGTFDAVDRALDDVARRLEGA